VVLSHDSHLGKDFCWCIKATSKLQRFLIDQKLLASCVVYSAGEIPFFPVDTLIDPSNHIPMIHATLLQESKLGRYWVKGRMPQDFHQRIAAAIRSHPVLEPKRKLILLTAIGERPKPVDPN
jgi:hypothetical protein